MMKQIIPILNGPNLNLLGTREPEIYGTISFDEFIWDLREKYSIIYIPYHQTNHEGELIDLLHRYGFESTGIILNPGGLTHTSVSLMDAIKSITSPVIEVHISKVSEREKFRQNSYIKSVCKSTIEGMGLQGYEDAINMFL